MSREVDEGVPARVGDLYVTHAARRLVEQIRRMTRVEREAVVLSMEGEPFLDAVAVLVDEVTMEEERAWGDATS